MAEPSASRGPHQEYADELSCSKITSDNVLRIRGVCEWRAAGLVLCLSSLLGLCVLYKTSSSTFPHICSPCQQRSHLLNTTRRPISPRWTSYQSNLLPKRRGAVSTMRECPYPSETLLMKSVSTFIKKRMVWNGMLMTRRECKLVNGQTRKGFNLTRLYSR